MNDLIGPVEYQVQQKYPSDDCWSWVDTLQTHDEAKEEVSDLLRMSDGYDKQYRIVEVYHRVVT